MNPLDGAAPSLPPGKDGTKTGASVDAERKSGAATDTAPAASVVIPVHDGAANLRECLAALRASDTSRFECIVADDGSSEDIGACAAAFGARMVRLDQRRGPAAARNRGAAAATAPILVFLDSDVRVHPDTLSRLIRALEGTDAPHAVFGSYDDRPAAGNFVSQFRNLLHHFVHQNSRTEASTFWAGCGAVLKSAFLSVGGFDERYSRPSIEDIDLGYRLRDRGYRIRLAPDIQATHLKRWTFVGVAVCDIRDRAVPWTKAMLDRGGLTDDLNVARASRWSGAAVVTAVIAAVAALTWPPAVLVSGLALVLAAGLQVRTYAFFFAKRGFWFGVRAVAMHMFYLLYSSVTFAVVLGARAIASKPRRKEAP